MEQSDNLYRDVLGPKKKRRQGIARHGRGDSSAAKERPRRLGRCFGQPHGEQQQRSLLQYTVRLIIAMLEWTAVAHGLWKNSIWLELSQAERRR